jgi:hypothetical protein
VIRAFVFLTRALVLVLSMTCADPLNAANLMTVDIGRMRAGAAPPHFAFTVTGDGPVTAWRVVADPSATAQNAIAQTTADQSDDRFLLAVYEPVAATDIDVTVHLKPIAGKNDHGGGVAVRFLTPDDYYVLRADALQDTVGFYRVVNGSPRQIKVVTAGVIPNRWHALRLRAEGDRFTIWFDGKQLFTVEDRTFTKPGNVALWTVAGSVTYFASITIKRLD